LLLLLLRRCNCCDLSLSLRGCRRSDAFRQESKTKTLCFFTFLKKLPLSNLAALDRGCLSEAFCRLLADAFVTAAVERWQNDVRRPETRRGASGFWCVNPSRVKYTLLLPPTFRNRNRIIRCRRGRDTNLLSRGGSNR